MVLPSAEACIRDRSLSNRLLKLRPKMVGTGEHKSTTNLPMWRRQHSRNIVAEVIPTSGRENWTACAWRLAGKLHCFEAGRHFALLTDAHTAADQLAGFTFEHRCDAACGHWEAMERPTDEDQALGRLQRTRSSNTAVEPPLTEKEFRAGDIIVTPVAHHYAIGRIGQDGAIQQHLQSDKNRGVALALACKFAGTVHRVFLFQSAGGSKFAPYNCRKILSDEDRPLRKSLRAKP